ncbi:response regulator [Streptomyces sp. NPDC001904]|uniref:response regulator n=1 Tax=Streptomyces sp. NPDC001904 TaxID=3154531 RepID=UPI0033295969
MKILLIDECAWGIKALEAALVPLDVPTAGASSNDAALKALIRGGVGLVVLTLGLPGADRLEVVRYMRRIGPMRCIPVITVSERRYLPGFVPEAAQLEVADVLTAPLDPQALRFKARYLLTVHGRCGTDHPSCS